MDFGILGQMPAASNVSKANVTWSRTSVSEAPRVMMSSTWLAHNTPASRKMEMTTRMNFSQTTGGDFSPNGRALGAYQRFPAPKPRYGIKAGSDGTCMNASLMSMVAQCVMA